MLSKHENTSGNAGTWKKLKEIQYKRTNSINSSNTTQLVHSKHLLFHLSLIFPFLANIHEFQKEAHAKNRYPVPCDIFCAMWKKQLDHTLSAITI